MGNSLYSSFLDQNLNSHITPLCRQKSVNNQQNIVSTYKVKDNAGSKDKSDWFVRLHSIILLISNYGAWTKQNSPIKIILALINGRLLDYLVTCHWSSLLTNSSLLKNDDIHFERSTIRTALVAFSTNAPLQNVFREEAGHQSGHNAPWLYDRRTISSKMRLIYHFLYYWI